MYGSSVRSLLALIFMVAATVSSAGIQAGVIEDIQKRGKIVIGLSTFVPWAMRAKNGDVVWRRLCAGRTLNWRQTAARPGSCYW